jgi:hypothetical protein
MPESLIDEVQLHEYSERQRDKESALETNLDDWIHLLTKNGLSPATPTQAAMEDMRKTLIDMNPFALAKRYVQVDNAYAPQT